MRGVVGASAVAVGGGGACALLAGGTVACWGANGLGQLGEGSSEGPQRCAAGGACAASAVPVHGLAGARAIAVGADHACALLAAGAVDCWGYNFAAELGIGTSSGVRRCAAGAWCATSPVAVDGLSGATAIAAGGDHTCALLAGGAVDCWGFNSFGQLGDGHSTGPATCYYLLVRCAKAPVRVAGLAPASALAAGGDHSCALLAGAAVDCWGANWFGELGDGARAGPGRCNFYPCSAAPVAVALPDAGISRYTRAGGTGTNEYTSQLSFS